MSTSQSPGGWKCFAFARCSLKLLYGFAFVVVCVFCHRFSNAQETFRVSYGGYNETAAPMWVGIEKGFFRKYGIDASMIQVRNGALSVATLVAKEVEAVTPLSQQF